MIRSLAIAFGLMTLFMFTLMACQPVQLMSLPAEGQEHIGSEMVKSCQAVINEAILSGQSDVIEDILRNGAIHEVFERIVILDKFTIEEQNLQALLLEGEGLIDLEGQLREHGYLEPGGATLASNFVVGAIESQGHSPSQSPFGVQPTYISTETATLATLTVYTEQWALKEIRGSQLYTDSRDTRGNGVNIAVFDTSPFAPSVTPFTGTVQVIPTDPEYTMTAQVHYADILGPSRDHGIFVAGLAKEIAREADLHLIRVLNESGTGNVFSLAKQMYEFYKNIHLKSGGTVAKSVANLSLSIVCDRESHQEDKVALQTFEKGISMLSHVITTMHESGVVMVAAAGNNGNVGATANTRRPIQAFPASHPYVIGVGASTLNGGGPACYSNQADVFAPGGAGIMSDKQCKAHYQQCHPSTGDCPHGLVGLATSSHSNLAYWAGTSFATPLVSGLMALWIADPMIETKAYTTTTGITYEVVNLDEIIKTDAAGKLNLPGYVTDCTIMHQSGEYEAYKCLSP